MPARRDPGTKVETKLGALRVRRGVTQRQLAEATGISLSVYIRLEHGRLKNPPIRYPANCAIALGVPLDGILEDGWKTWTAFDGGPPEPPKPMSLRRTPPKEKAPPRRGPCRARRVHSDSLRSGMSDIAGRLF